MALLPEALKKEGFGIITQIDIQATFKEKLGADFRRYRIFGACNPTFAHAALLKDPHVAEIQKDGIIFIDFWGAGAARAARSHRSSRKPRSDTQTSFGAKVDTDAEQELAGALRIRSIPTLMVFRDGVLVFAQPGVLPAAALDDLVAQVRALDMDEVRRKVSDAKVA